MKFQSVRGTHDIYGDEIIKYRYLEDILRSVVNIYDFEEIVTPIFESTDLFKKPLGEQSDIVLKEMYTFKDRNESFLTLRPEYTTPMIRAAISNNLLEKLPQKLFGIGPMFRRERPQKGRYRQFNQINFEILGSYDVAADFELILLANDFLKKILPTNKIELELNSLGDKNTLRSFKENLCTYFAKHKEALSEESQTKIENNPLRILDSKNSNDIEINKNAPKISDFYSKDTKKNFDDLLKLLTNSSLDFKVNSNLVRGLDYYCQTVFEFKTNDLGSQNTLIGGGRYDGLIKLLGGPDIPGVGWAGGIERMILLLQGDFLKKQKTHLILIDKKFKDYGLELLNKLRMKNIPIYFDYKYNLKKSLSFANQSRAKYAIIIGEDELEKEAYTIKNLDENTQAMVSFEEIVSKLTK